MASNTNPAATFAGLPSFPEDVATAPLLRLSLKKLAERDEVEIQRLNAACEDLGFFYLDLQEASLVPDILDDVDELFHLGFRLFELPLEEKQKYDLSSQKSYFGYKAQGAAVVDRQGNLDRNEFYNVSKDDIMGISEPLPAPDVIRNNRKTLMSFMRTSHSIVTLILDLLNESLGLPQSTLTNLHSLHAISGDQVRFVKAPPQPVDDRRTALGEHTDFGSVTILFNRLGGLQVLPPGADADWVYVRPLPGHAIVNLGDAMVKFTNGLLRSNIHRVVSPPGEQANCTRYSLVYFARPEDNVPLRRLVGSSRIPALDEGVVEEDINSKDWIIRRALGLRVNVPEINYEMSAGTEVLSRRLKAPRAWATPPRTPTHWSGSVATTPESIATSYIQSERDPVPVGIRRLSLQLPAPRTQADDLKDIDRRRSIFLTANRNLIEPVVRNSLRGGLFPTPSCSDSKIVPYALCPQPRRLRASLKQYQLEGFSWLLYLKNNGVGGILGDDMGLGKTLQTLSVFQHMKDRDTPIQNDLTELWSILRWLYPEVFVPSTTQDFEEAFSLTKGACDSLFLDNLTKFLSLVMLRRTKSSPHIGLNIPEKKETIISVPLTDLQLAWYHEILTGVKGLATPGPTSLIDLAMDDWESQGATASKKKSRITTNVLMELRKCSIHPYLLADAIPEDYSLGEHIVQTSGKFIVLQKMIRQFVVIEKKKITIFSGFDQALNLCEDLLQMEKSHAPFGHVRLDGSTTNAWRKLSLFLFANDPRCKVFLLSIRAGGEGLNLVSSSTVIFVDDDWNPQIMRQAEARVHRLGQTEPVQIFRLHARGTVEDQMRRRLTKKAYLADQVMKAPPGDNRYSPMDLDSEAPGELALAPRNSVAHDARNVKELANSDLSTILICCTINEENAFEMSRAEKKEWLERAERVKTNIFNGEQIDTSSRGYSVYKETIIGASKASRRIGKSRVVIIDDWEVSRDSVEAALKLNSPTKPKPKAALKAGKINDTRNTIICPQHNCCECGKPASQVGRLLFACLQCPRAYCEHCLDWSKTTYIGNDAKGESCGYFPTSAYYIICFACRAPTRKRQLDDMDLDTSKRSKHY
ncbi:hypothetical protein BJX66DRAFT_324082 [Aspergillus keveii]|uniref:Fe2OG dioxygenase domain-containing protein n=1 Tax=Aspergillus keveii TaxID=714993 RepID=A0ABR4GCQ3_9EURO